MLFPFLNSFGDLEEYDFPEARPFFEIPRVPEFTIQLKSIGMNTDYNVEVFKKHNLAYKIKNKYCRVSCYISENYGLYPVDKENREKFIEVNLKQMAPYLFTYGERYIYPGQEPVEKGDK